MTVGRICSREVDTCEAQESVQQAAQRMHSRKVGTLVVVDPARRPIGILTDRDIAVRVVAKGGDAPQTPVREVMTAAPKTLAAESSIQDALEVMRHHQCRRVPIVDGADQLAGLLSVDDVLGLVIDELKSLGGLLREESPQSLAKE